MNTISSPEYISVREVNEWVKDVLDSHPLFRSLTIRGEVSNFKRYPTAMYFSLKDGAAKINVVMFLYQQFPAYVPKDGDDVLVTGQVTLYVKDGSYQLAAKQIRLFGEGDQLLALKKLKEKLAAEGFFDAARKRSFPTFPKHLIVITGKDSAALKDITYNMGRRYPLVSLTVIPAKVQGPLAVQSLLEALNHAFTLDADGIILARGGGAEEDLSAFNDESLVRKLALSPFPIVSAIGHEINLSLTDLVADLRASTPTAAVELITEDVHDVLQSLQSFRLRLENQLKSQLEQLKQPLMQWKRHPVMKSPYAHLMLVQDKVTQLKQKLHQQIKWVIERYREKVTSTKEQLRALSPDEVLKRGFSYTLLPNGKLLRSMKDVKEGDRIQTRMKDGMIQSVVDQKMKE